MELDGMEASTRCSAAALDSLRHHGLPPTPINYTIWFEFHAGRNATLTKALSVALSNRRHIDSFMMAELYDLFFAASASTAATREARATLREAAGRILEAGADARRFGETLTEAVETMDETPVGLTGLITRLATETAALSAKSARLGMELHASGERINELEKQLAAAQQASMTDALTTLANRRAFDAMVLEYAGQAMNSGSELCLLMIDIDHFKRVNDLWGHAVGDAVIRLVAATIAQHLPAGARAARYGGEEFAMLLPATALDRATAHADTVRGVLAARRISLRANAEPIGSVTVSVGAARYEPGEAVSAWIERADAALYSAKQSGRNRVVAFDAAPVVVD
jgi:diguanylate cyclase